MTMCRSCDQEYKPEYGCCESCGGDGETEDSPDLSSVVATLVEACQAADVIIGRVIADRPPWVLSTDNQLGAVRAMLLEARKLANLYDANMH